MFCTEKAVILVRDALFGFRGEGKGQGEWRYGVCASRAGLWEASPGVAPSQTDLHSAPQDRVDESVGRSIPVCPLLLTGPKAPE